MNRFSRGTNGEKPELGRSKSKKRIKLSDWSSKGTSKSLPPNMKVKGQSSFKDLIENFIQRQKDHLSRITENEKEGGSLTTNEYQYANNYSTAPNQKGRFSISTLQISKNSSEMGLSMDTQRNNTGRMSGFSESRPKAKNSSSVRVQSGSKITDNSGNLIMHTMSNLNHVFNSSNRSQGHKSDYVKVSGAHGVNSKASRRQTNGSAYFQDRSIEETPQFKQIMFNQTIQGRKSLPPISGFLTNPKSPRSENKIRGNSCEKKRSGRGKLLSKKSSTNLTVALKNKLNFKKKDEVEADKEQQIIDGFNNSNGGITGNVPGNDDGSDKIRILKLMSDDSKGVRLFFKDFASINLDGKMEEVGRLENEMNDGVSVQTSKKVTPSHTRESSYSNSLTYKGKISDISKDTKKISQNMVDKQKERISNQRKYRIKLPDGKDESMKNSLSHLGSTSYLKMESISDAVSCHLRNNSTIENHLNNFEFVSISDNDGLLKNSSHEELAGKLCKIGSKTGLKIKLLSKSQNSLPELVRKRSNEESAVQNKGKWRRLKRDNTGRYGNTGDNGKQMGDIRSNLSGLDRIKSVDSLHRVVNKSGQKIIKRQITEIPNKMNLSFARVKDSPLKTLLSASQNPNIKNPGVKRYSIKSKESENGRKIADKSNSKDAKKYLNPTNPEKLRYNSTSFNISGSKISKISLKPRIIKTTNSINTLNLRKQGSGSTKWQDSFLLSKTNGTWTPRASERGSQPRVSSHFSSKFAKDTMKSYQSQSVHSKAHSKNSRFATESQSQSHSQNMIVADSGSTRSKTKSPQKTHFNRNNPGLLSDSSILAGKMRPTPDSQKMVYLNRIRKSGNANTSQIQRTDSELSVYKFGRISQYSVTDYNSMRSKSIGLSRSPTGISKNKSLSPMPKIIRRTPTNPKKLNIEESKSDFSEKRVLKNEKKSVYKTVSGLQNLKENIDKSKSNYRMIYQSNAQSSGVRQSKARDLGSILLSKQEKFQFRGEMKAKTPANQKEVNFANKRRARVPADMIRNLKNFDAKKYKIRRVAKSPSPTVVSRRRTQISPVPNSKVSNKPVPYSPVSNSNSNKILEVRSSRSVPILSPKVPSCAKFLESRRHISSKNILPGRRIISQKKIKKIVTPEDADYIKIIAANIEFARKKKKNPSTAFLEQSKSNFVFDQSRIGVREQSIRGQLTSLNDVVTKKAGNFSKNYQNNKSNNNNYVAKNVPRSYRNVPESSNNRIPSYTQDSEKNFHFNNQDNTDVKKIPNRSTSRSENKIHKLVNTKKNMTQINQNVRPQPRQIMKNKIKNEVKFGKLSLIPESESYKENRVSNCRSSFSNKQYQRDLRNLLSTSNNCIQVKTIKVEDSVIPKKFEFLAKNNESKGKSHKNLNTKNIKKSFTGNYEYPEKSRSKFFTKYKGKIFETGKIESEIFNKVSKMNLETISEKMMEHLTKLMSDPRIREIMGEVGIESRPFPKMGQSEHLHAEKMKDSSIRFGKKSGLKFDMKSGLNSDLKADLGCSDGEKSGRFEYNGQKQTWVNNGVNMALIQPNIVMNIQTGLQNVNCQTSSRDYNLHYFAENEKSNKDSPKIDKTENYSYHQNALEKENLKTTTNQKNQIKILENYSIKKSDRKMFEESAMKKFQIKQIVSIVMDQIAQNQQQTGQTEKVIRQNIERSLHISKVLEEIIPSTKKEVLIPETLKIEEANEDDVSEYQVTKSSDEIYLCDTPSNKENSQSRKIASRKDSSAKSMFKPRNQPLSELTLKSNFAVCDSKIVDPRFDFSQMKRNLSEMNKGQPQSERAKTYCRNEIEIDNGFGLTGTFELGNYLHSEVSNQEKIRVVGGEQNQYIDETVLNCSVDDLDDGENFENNENDKNIENNENYENEENELLDSESSLIEFGSEIDLGGMSENRGIEETQILNRSISQMNCQEMGENSKLNTKRAKKGDLLYLSEQNCVLSDLQNREKTESGQDKTRFDESSVNIKDESNRENAESFEKSKLKVSVKKIKENKKEEEKEALSSKTLSEKKSSDSLKLQDMMQLGIKTRTLEGAEVEVINPQNLFGKNPSGSLGSEVSLLDVGDFKRDKNQKNSPPHPSNEIIVDPPKNKKNHEQQKEDLKIAENLISIKQTSLGETLEQERKTPGKTATAERRRIDGYYKIDSETFNKMIRFRVDHRVQRGQEFNGPSQEILEFIELREGQTEKSKKSESRKEGKEIENKKGDFSVQMSFVEKSESQDLKNEIAQSREKKDSMENISAKKESKKENFEKTSNEEIQNQINQKDFAKNEKPNRNNSERGAKPSEDHSVKTKEEKIRVSRNKTTSEELWNMSFVTRHPKEKKNRQSKDKKPPKKLRKVMTFGDMDRNHLAGAQSKSCQEVFGQGRERVISFRKKTRPVNVDGASKTDESFKEQNEVRHGSVSEISETESRVALVSVRSKSPETVQGTQDHFHINMEELDNSSQSSCDLIGSSNEGFSGSRLSESESDDESVQKIEPNMEKTGSQKEKSKLQFDDFLKNNMKTEISVQQDQSLAKNSDIGEINRGIEQGKASGLSKLSEMSSLLIKSSLGQGQFGEQSRWRCQVQSQLDKREKRQLLQRERKMSRSWNVENRHMTKASQGSEKMRNRSQFGGRERADRFRKLSKNRKKSRQRQRKLGYLPGTSPKSSILLKEFERDLKKFQKRQQQKNPKSKVNPKKRRSQTPKLKNPKKILKTVNFESTKQKSKISANSKISKITGSKSWVSKNLSSGFSIRNQEELVLTKESLAVEMSNKLTQPRNLQSKKWAEMKKKIFSKESLAKLKKVEKNKKKIAKKRRGKSKEKFVPNFSRKKEAQIGFETRLKKIISKNKSGKSLAQKKIAKNKNLKIRSKSKKKKKLKKPKKSENERKKHMTQTYTHFETPKPRVLTSLGEKKDSLFLKHRNVTSLRAMRRFERQQVKKPSNYTTLEDFGRRANQTTQSSCLRNRMKQTTPTLSRFLRRSRKESSLTAKSWNTEMGTLKKRKKAKREIKTMKSGENLRFFSDEMHFLAGQSSGIQVRDEIDWEVTCSEGRTYDRQTSDRQQRDAYLPVESKSRDLMGFDSEFGDYVYSGQKVGQNSDFCRKSDVLGKIQKSDEKKFNDGCENKNLGNEIDFGQILSDFDLQKMGNLCKILEIIEKSNVAIKNKKKSKYSDLKFEIMLQSNDKIEEKNIFKLFKSDLKNFKSDKNAKLVTDNSIIENDLVIIRKNSEKDQKMKNFSPKKKYDIQILNPSSHIKKMEQDKKISECKESPDAESKKRKMTPLRTSIQETNQILELAENILYEDNLDQESNNSIKNNNTRDCKSKYVINTSHKKSENLIKNEKSCDTSSKKPIRLALPNPEHFSFSQIQDTKQGLPDPRTCSQNSMKANYSGKKISLRYLNRDSSELDSGQMITKVADLRATRVSKNNLTSLHNSNRGGKSESFNAANGRSGVGKVGVKSLFENGIRGFDNGEGVECGVFVGFGVYEEIMYQNGWLDAECEGDERQRQEWKINILFEYLRCMAREKFGSAQALNYTIELESLKRTLISWENHLICIEKIISANPKSANSENQGEKLQNYFKSLEIPEILKILVKESVASGVLVWDYYNESNLNLLSQLSETFENLSNGREQMEKLNLKLSEPEWTNEFKIFWELIINKIEFLYNKTCKNCGNGEIGQTEDNDLGKFEEIEKSGKKEDEMGLGGKNIFEDEKKLFENSTEKSFNMRGNQNPKIGNLQTTKDLEIRDKKFNPVKNKNKLFTVREVSPISVLAKTPDSPNLFANKKSFAKKKNTHKTSKSQQLRNLKRDLRQKTLDQQKSHLKSLRVKENQNASFKSSKWSDFKHQILNSSRRICENSKLTEFRKIWARSASRSLSKPKNLKKNQSVNEMATFSRIAQSERIARKPRIKKRVLSRRRIDFEEAKNPSLQNLRGKKVDRYKKKRNEMARESLKRKIDYVLERDAMAYSDLEKTGFAEKLVQAEWSRLKNEERRTQLTLSRSKMEKDSAMRSASRHQSATGSVLASGHGLTKSGFSQVNSQRISLNIANSTRKRSQMRNENPSKKAQTQRLSANGSPFSINEIYSESRATMNLGVRERSQSLLAQKPVGSDQGFGQSLHIGNRGIVKSQSSKRFGLGEVVRSTRSGVKKSYHSQYLLKKSLSLERGKKRCGNGWLKRPQDPFQTLNSDASGFEINHFLNQFSRGNLFGVQRIASEPLWEDSRVNLSSQNIISKNCKTSRPNHSSFARKGMNALVSRKNLQSERRLLPFQQKGISQNYNFEKEMRERQSKETKDQGIQVNFDSKQKKRSQSGTNLWESDEKITKSQKINSSFRNPRKKNHRDPDSFGQSIPTKTEKNVFNADYTTEKTNKNAAETNAKQTEERSDSIRDSFCTGEEIKGWEAPETQSDLSDLSSDSETFSCRKEIVSVSFQTGKKRMDSVRKSLISKSGFSSNKKGVVNGDGVSSQRKVGEKLRDSSRKNIQSQVDSAIVSGLQADFMKDSKNDRILGDGRKSPKSRFAANFSVKFNDDDATKNLKLDENIRSELTLILGPGQKTRIKLDGTEARQIEMLSEKFDLGLMERKKVVRLVEQAIQGKKIDPQLLS